MLVWSAFQHNGAENLAVEIFDKGGKRLAASDVITSGKADQTDGIDAFNAFMKTLKLAHQNSDDSSAWTVRMVHNHPSGFGHSSGDIRVSLDYKQLLEQCGYGDATFRMAVMPSGGTVIAYDLGPEISLQNRSYAPNRKTKQGESIGKTRETLTYNARVLQAALEKKVGMITVNGPVLPQLELVASASLKQKETIVLYHGSKDAELEDASVATLDPKLTLTGGLVDLIFDERVQSRLRAFDSNSESFHLFVSPKEETNHDKLIELALDIRAILDRLDFKGDLVLEYKAGPNTLKRLSLNQGFRIDGEQYISGVIRALLEKIP